MFLAQRRRLQPIGVAGLVAWWEANNTDTPTDGSAITTWADRSGLARSLTQPTPTNRPFYRANVLNGYPVVRFDGSNDYLSRVPIHTGATARTHIYVVKHASTTGNQFLCWQGGGSDGTLWGIAAHSGTEPAFLGWAGGDYNPGSPPTDIAWKIVSVSYDGTTVRLRKNGTQTGSAARSLNTANASLFIGSTNGPAEFFHGDMAEIAVYNGRVADATLLEIERGLADKYGLTVA